jgi:hypothetical protein
MKTQVIQLETHDDVISTQDKMMWSKSARILLVWPGTRKILNHKADLILLHRFSRKLGTQLALITKDMRVQFHANEIGIPVFDSIEAAQRRPWRRAWLRNKAANIVKISTRVTSGELRERKPFVKAKERNHTFIRFISFSLGILAFFCLMVFFLPGAEVNLEFAQNDQSVTFDVLANQETDYPNISGSIPANKTSVIVEGMDRISSSGSDIQHEGRASGIVQFTNISNHTLEIPVGTIVMTLDDNPVRFRTMENALSSNLDDDPVEVEIQAVEPGSLGNVQAGELVAIEGEIGLFVSVFNPAPLSGGTEREVPYPTESDYVELFERLLSTLELTAIGELEARMSTGQQLIHPTLVLDRIIQEKRDPAEAQPTDDLTLTLQVQFNALYILDEDLQNIAGMVLDANTMKGYMPVSTEIRLTQLFSPLVDEDGNISIRLLAEREIQQKIEYEQISQELAGLNLQEARSYFETHYELEKEPEFNLFPEFWRRLPFLAFRIEVNPL